jgi:hypothetical protein
MVFLSVHGGSGIAMVIVATVATAVRPVCAANLMAGKDKPKLDAAKVLFYEQCMTIPFMLLLSICYFPNLKEAFEFLGSSHGPMGFAIIIVRLSPP